jgi:hypothetical protein
MPWNKGTKQMARIVDFHEAKARMAMLTYDFVTNTRKSRWPAQPDDRDALKVATVLHLRALRAEATRITTMSNA